MSKELLAVDIDEVLFPMLESFLEDHNPRYGTNHQIGDFKSYDFEHALGLPVDETVRRVYEYLASDHNHVRAVEGSQASISRLTKRYDFLVVTARDEQFEHKTMDWLHQRYGRVFKDIACIGYGPIQEVPKIKAEVCASLGACALIDDSLHHVVPCYENDIEGILFGKYPWNAASPSKLRRLHIVRRANWQTNERYLNARAA